MTGRLVNPPPSSPATTKVMRANRAKNSKPERTLRAALRTQGLSGYRLHWDRVPGRPDIAFPGRRLAIFVHGCFWHQCPLCRPRFPTSHAEFWAQKFAANRQRDKRKASELQAIGWQVIEIWECETVKRIDLVVDRVRVALEERGGTAVRVMPAALRTRPSPY